MKTKMFEFETQFDNRNRPYCTFTFYDDGTYIFKTSSQCTYNRMWVLEKGELRWKNEQDSEDNFTRWSSPDKCVEITYLINSYYAEKELLGE